MEKFTFEVDASSCSFKITCILSRQVISLQEDGGIVTKTDYLNLMVSYLYSFNPFIGINKLTSTSAAIMYDSIENKQPCQNPPVRVNRSNRRLFTLILGLDIGVCIFNHLSTYPNLRKAEKLKSQSTQGILQKNFYSVFLIQPLCNK